MLKLTEKGRNIYLEERNGLKQNEFSALNFVSTVDSNISKTATLLHNNNSRLTNHFLQWYGQNLGEGGTHDMNEYKATNKSYTLKQYESTLKH